MRIDEFASAEEQMALWKLVNDKVWQAIDAQRQQQAQAAQAKAAKAKLKPRKGRKGGRGKLSIPMPPPPPSPKAPHAKKPEASANPQQAKPQNLQPSAQGQQIAQRQPLAQPHTAAAPIAPTNASTAPQDGVFAQKLVQKNSPPHGDDRHSKNGYPVNPVHKLKPMGAMPRPQQMR
jgi:hypothetical protein